MSGDAGRGVPVWALPTLVAALCAWAYVATLAPTVASSRDSAELALAVVELGVAHPTGYPLYTLLGHAWVGTLAFGDPGWRLNLFSALCSAFAMGLLADLLRRLTRRREAAWLGALVFAFSPLVWQEANVAEVYALHLLLQVAILWSWQVWEDTDDPRWLSALAFTVGLSLTHHMMTVLLLPCLGLALLLRWRAWWSVPRALRLAAWLLAPLALYAYIPIVIASGTEICWTDLSTPGSIWGHVLGGGYAASNLEIGDPSFWQRAARYPRGIAAQFGVALALVPLGIWSQRGRPRQLWPLAAGYSTSLVFALAYQVIDPDPFYLTSCLFLAIWIGAGAAWLCETSARGPVWLGPAVSGVALALPALSWVAHVATNDRSDDFAIYDREMAALAAAEPDSVFLTWGDNNFALYLHRVHGLRPDLEVVPLRLTIRCDLPPALSEIRQSRRTLRGEGLAETLTAVRRLDGRPRALVASPVEAGTGWESFGLRIVDAGALTRLVPLDDSARPSSLVAPSSTGGARSEPGIELAGVTPAAVSVSQGDVLELRYDWHRNSESPTRETIVTYLGDSGGAPALRPDGRPAFEHTHALGGSVVVEAGESGARLEERLLRFVPHDMPSGEWTLWVRPPGATQPVASGPLRVTEGTRVPWTLPRVWRTP